jgi:hypothetical protein
MLTTIEDEMNFNSMIIKDAEDFKYLISCPAFSEYLNACVKGVDNIYMSALYCEWNNDADEVYIPLQNTYLGEHFNQVLAGSDKVDMDKAETILLQMI